MSELYIGLMSGTSADGINAVAVNFIQKKPKLVGSLYHEYPLEFRRKILALYHPGADEITRLAELDVKIAHEFANVTNQLLKQFSLPSSSIRAIGSHGQTIRHHPEKNFTLQIGDPNIISAKTGIITIADFRRRDLAWGGQGAPLVPAFHQAIFSAHTNRAIVNIGGIANITILKPNEPVLGFDTGPGNSLLDYWIEKQLNRRYDHHGEWAATGSCNFDLLESFLKDDYFKLPAPKSTGRHYFNEHWLSKHFLAKIKPADIQATLVELTAKSIIRALPFKQGEVLICGGGAHNQYLMTRLKQLGDTLTIDSTEKFGVHPDWVEAMAFAWLAKQTMENKPGNIPEVTGASQATVLGGIYFV